MFQYAWLQLSLLLPSTSLIINAITKPMRAVHQQCCIQDVPDLRAYVARFLTCAGPNSLAWAVRECRQRQ